MAAKSLSKKGGRKPAIYTRNAFHRHPAAQAINWHFGERGNNYAEALRDGLRHLYLFARNHCRDGWLSEREAIALLAAGRQLRTGRRRLADLLTLTDHFEQRADGVVLLKTMFLSAQRRLDALEKYDQKRDSSALRHRTARLGKGAMVAPVARRRRKYGPPGPPQTHSVGGAEITRTDLESCPLAQRPRQITSDPPPEVGGVPVKKPAAEREVAPDWEAMANMSTAEKRAWLAKDDDAQWEAKRRAPPPELGELQLARNADGMAIVLLDMGLEPKLIAHENLTEAQLMAGRAKVLQRYGDGPGKGALIVHAARLIRDGKWRPAYPVNFRPRGR